jgi:hypothetical protein
VGGRKRGGRGEGEGREREGRGVGEGWAGGGVVMHFNAGFAQAKKVSETRHSEVSRYQRQETDNVDKIV